MYVLRLDIVLYREYIDIYWFISIYNLNQIKYIEAVREQFFFKFVPVVGRLDPRIVPAKEFKPRSYEANNEDAALNFRKDLNAFKKWYSKYYPCP